MPGPAHDALVEYIEDALGQSIEEAYPDEWEAAEGGEEQDITIDLGDDRLKITLDQCCQEAACEDLGEFTLTLEEQDFTIQTNQIGAPTSFPVSGGNQINTYYWTPQYDIHLEHPKLEWINQAFNEDFTAFLDPRANLWGGGDGQVSVGSDTYAAAIRINGHFTFRPALLRVNFIPSNPSTPQSDNWSMTYESPPLGLMVVRRAPSGTTGQLTVDDPIRLGIPLGTGNPDDDQGVEDSDYSLVKDPQAGSDPNGQGDLGHFFLAGSQSAFFLDYGNWPGVLETWVGTSNAAGEDAGPPQAWLDFTADIDAYNANEGNNPYSPDVTYDVDAKTVTISFMTEENAIYMPTFGCALSGGSPSAETLNYDAVAINYGNYVYHASGYDNGPQLYTNTLPQLAHRNDFMEGIQERLVAGGDPDVHTTKTDFKRKVPPGSVECEPCLTDARCIAPGS
jgi:hypothetical protein